VQERLQFQFIEDNTHMADEALAALLRGATALDRLGMGNGAPAMCTTGKYSTAARQSMAVDKYPCACLH
jgi:hypothetical protein